MEDRQAGTGARAAPGELVSGWRLSVDAGRCIGSGLCASTAPRHFRLEGRVSQAVAELVEPDEAVRDAADFCPPRPSRCARPAPPSWSPTAVALRVWGARHPVPSDFEMNDAGKSRATRAAGQPPAIVVTAGARPGAAELRRGARHPPDAQGRWARVVDLLGMALAGLVIGVLALLLFDVLLSIIGWAGSVRSVAGPRGAAGLVLRRRLPGLARHGRSGGRRRGGGRGGARPGPARGRADRRPAAAGQQRAGCAGRHGRLRAHLVLRHPMVGCQVR